MTRPASAILRRADRPEIARPGGARTHQMVTPDCGAAAFLAGFTDIPPGGAIPLHYHDCEEHVLILDGTAKVEVDGQIHDAAAGDVVWQQAGVPHRFINASDNAPLRIYWTYASVTATRTLVDSGDTAPILAEAAGPA